jgi:hypothetical protein
VYDVEEVLGRDASSVFPSMQAQLDPMEQLKAAMGAKRFVTETEVRGCMNTGAAVLGYLLAGSAGAAAAAVGAV